ncbi:MAG: NmrA family NAD(P)-binding protein, partial [Halioglobus sp.]|nr:NmrA family NAD(P)-binding protein [Halioglobus sp.]
MPVDPVDMRGARILITGPTGQVALPVVEHFAKIADVHALARFSKPADRDTIEALGATVIAADLADPAAVAAIP